MNLNDKIYIAGHRGMVGSAILRQLKAEGYSNFILRTSSELDLRNQQAVANFLNRKNQIMFFWQQQKLEGLLQTTLIEAILYMRI